MRFDTLVHFCAACARVEGQASNYEQPANLAQPSRVAAIIYCIKLQFHGSACRDAEKFNHMVCAGDQCSSVPRRNLPRVLPIHGQQYALLPLLGFL
eukprot:6245667-Amphidinium_carterae.1